MRATFLPTLVVLLFAVAAIARPQGPAEQPQARAFYPPPSQDPFYRFPSNLASLTRGAVIRQRPVPTFVGPAASSATQVLYRSETAEGQPDATVATFFTPWIPAPGPPKVLVILLPQDSASFDCSPSWALIPGTASNSSVIVTLPNLPAFYAALAQGWYVVAPDHEGSQASFIAGPQSGRASIDSVRAFLNLRKIAPSSDYRAAFYGYSGGAHAAAWANQLSSTYGGDLKLLGAAYGGTVAYLRPTIDFLNKGLFAGFGGAGIAGLANAYPELNSYINTILQPNGTAALATLRGPAGCTFDELRLFAFANFYSYTTIPDPLDQPVPQKYIASNNLGATTLARPAYIYHSSQDEVIEFGQIEQYVKDQCARGAKINFAVSDIGPHFTTLVTGLPSAFIWLRQLMDGTLKQDSCVTERGPFVGLGTPQAVQALGPQGVAAAWALNGFKLPGGNTIKL